MLEVLVKDSFAGLVSVLHKVAMCWQVDPIVRSTLDMHILNLTHSIDHTQKLAALAALG